MTSVTSSSRAGGQGPRCSVSAPGKPAAGGGGRRSPRGQPAPPCAPAPSCGRPDPVLADGAPRPAGGVRGGREPDGRADRLSPAMPRARPRPALAFIPGPIRKQLVESEAAPAAPGEIWGRGAPGEGWVGVPGPAGRGDVPRRPRRSGRPRVVPAARKGAAGPGCVSTRRLVAACPPGRTVRGSPRCRGSPRSPAPAPGPPPRGCRPWARVQPPRRSPGPAARRQPDRSAQRWPSGRGGPGCERVSPPDWGSLRGTSWGDATRFHGVPKGPKVPRGDAPASGKPWGWGALRWVSFPRCP